MDENTFGAADFVVFSLILTISVCIGIFFACYRKGQSTTVNYFLGDRRLKVVPVALSFVVSFQSSILILGVPAEAYAYGMQFVIQSFGVLIGNALAAAIIVPVFHPLKLTSVYEYFPKRYGNNTVRYLAVTFALSFHIFYSGVVILGTALAMESVVNLSFSVSVIIFSSTAIIYTSIGGIRAVIWTDVFQASIMLAGILAVIIKCSLAVGGWENIIYLSRSRFNFFDFNPDPTQRHAFWSLFFGSIPVFLYTAFSQSAVQRMNSVPTIKSAKRMLYIAGPTFALGMVLALFEGVLVYAYFYKKGCDPIAAKTLKNLNQIIPLTVMELFVDLPGLPGLFISALAAASLSTISSALNSMAAITYEDIINARFPRINEKTGTYISKAIVVIFGIISSVIAIVATAVNVPLVQIIITCIGAFGGPVNGIFLLSIFHHRATSKGVVTGTLIGFAFSMWLLIGQTFSGTVEKTPYLPLGPTYSCSNSTENITTTVTTELLPNNSNMYHGVLFKDTFAFGSQSVPNSAIFTVMAATNMTTILPVSNRKSVLQTFYSISYLYFNLIGTIITICVGILMSMLTQPKVQFKYDKQCVLPLSVFIPRCVDRMLPQRTKKKQTKEKNYTNEAHDYEFEVMVPSSLND